MPSFPASVWSPTVKSAGAVIDAAHINDPQDEIVAIEGGYLNGTARLNSSQSTVVSLSVSSNSTFALRPTMPPPDAARVFLTSTYAAGSSAESTLSFLGQVFLTNSSMHSTTTNPERLIPQSTGLYQISAQVSVSVASAAAVRQINLRDSSATDIALMRTPDDVSIVTINLTGYKRFDVVGGYVTCVWSGGVSTASLSSGAGVTWFAMVKL